MKKIPFLSKDNIPIIVLLAILMYLLPWVSITAREQPPVGLEQWKERALEMETGPDVDAPDFKLYIKEFHSDFFPASATASYWIISASEAQLETAEKLELALPMLRIIEPDDDETVIVARSSEGFCLMNGDLIQLRGNVRLRTYNVTAESGDYLEAENLWYDAKKKIFYTEGDYVVTKGKSTVKGTGFESNADLTRMKFKKIRGQVDPELDFSK